MKKIWVSVAVSLIAFSFCHGGAVAWNNAWVDNSYGSPRLGIMLAYPSSDPMSNIVGYTLTDINVASTPTQAVVTMDDKMLASVCTILLLPVSYGTPIDYGLFANSTDPFFRTYNPATGTSISQTGLTIPLYETVFLAFAFENLSTIPPGSFTDLSYGWVELGYKDGEVYVVSSAQETTGLGLYAGTGTAIPEPSTTLLALSGLAVLCLRRRKIHGRFL